MFPEWFLEAEKTSNCYGYDYPTTLHIIPNKPEYKPVAELLVKFLYSTSHEAFRDG